MFAFCCSAHRRCTLSTPLPPSPSLPAPTGPPTPPCIPHPPIPPCAASPVFGWGVSPTRPTQRPQSSSFPFPHALALADACQTKCSSSGGCSDSVSSQLQADDDTMDDAASPVTLWFRPHSFLLSQVLPPLVHSFIHLHVAQRITRRCSGWAQCSTPTPHIQYNISAQLLGNEWMVQRRWPSALHRARP